MTTFEIIAILVSLFLLGIVTWSNWVSTKEKAIPGCPPSDPKTGNISDIDEAGSLHEFLTKLHGKFGDLASFWMGTKMAVSICTPELFRQHSKVFDRPWIFFEFLVPLASHRAIQYANGEEGKRRRNTTDPVYSHANVNEAYLPIFLKIAEDLAERWKRLPKDQHIPLTEDMFHLALKSIAEASFGTFFSDDKEVSKLKESYDICMEEMERLFKGDDFQDQEDRQKQFDDYKSIMVNLMKSAIKERKTSTTVKEGDLLIDILSQSESEEVALSDSIIYFVAGFHTTGLMMTWAMFYLATHEDVQQRCYQELMDVLGDEPVLSDATKELVYLRQVLDETLRCAQLGPFAARYSDTEMELGGYSIPAGTPVVHALGVSLHDERLWEDPTRFDPERFSPENRKKLPPYGFEPFGFAGKRKCPGYRFSYVEGIVFLSVLLRKFKIQMVPGQTVIKDYGFVTKPKEEVWITVGPRK